MMNPSGSQTHRIGRQVIELTLSGHLSGNALADEVSRIYRQRIVPLIEQTCNELAGPDRVLRFGTLELDLGMVQAEELEPQMVSRVAASLREQLQTASEQAQGQSRESVKQQSALELFSSFVTTGNLPWWAERHNPALLVTNLQQLLRDSPSALKSTLAGLVRDPLACQRLTGHYSDAQLAQLCALYFSGAGNAIGARMKTLLAALQRCASSRDWPPARLRQRSWGCALELAIGGVAASESLAQFMHAVLRRMAQELACDDSDLIPAVMQILRDGKLPNSAPLLASLQRLPCLAQAPGNDGSMETDQVASRVTVSNADQDAARGVDSAAFKVETREETREVAREETGNEVREAGRGAGINDAREKGRGAGPDAGGKADRAAGLATGREAGTSAGGNTDRKAGGTAGEGTGRNVDRAAGGKAGPDAKVDRAAGRKAGQNAEREVAARLMQRLLRLQLASNGALREAWRDLLKQVKVVAARTALAPASDLSGGQSAREQVWQQLQAALAGSPVQAASRVLACLPDLAMLEIRALAPQFAAALPATMRADEVQDALAHREGANCPADDPADDAARKATRDAGGDSANNSARNSTRNSASNSASNAASDAAGSAVTGAANEAAGNAPGSAVNDAAGGMSNRLHPAGVQDGGQLASAPDGAGLIRSAPPGGIRQSAAGCDGADVEAALTVLLRRYHSRGGLLADLLQAMLDYCWQWSPKVQQHWLLALAPELTNSIAIAAPPAPAEKGRPETGTGIGAETASAVSKGLATKVRRVALLDPDSLAHAIAHMLQASPAQHGLSGQLRSRLLSLLRAPQRIADAGDNVPIDNAGLVLLWPFLGSFFGHLGLLEERDFKDLAARQRAVGLLQVLATPQTRFAEYALPLNKLLCNLEQAHPFEFGPRLKKREVRECNQLLEAVIAQAPILKNMSPDGFRGSFLLRKGVLSSRAGHWLLQVEAQTYDIVLDRLPWSRDWIKLPWMEAPLRVEWSI